MPTVIIRGMRDQIAPFADPEWFVAELRKNNIAHGFLRPPEADHTHDLELRTGSGRNKLRYDIISCST